MPKISKEPEKPKSIPNTEKTIMLVVTGADPEGGICTTFEIDFNFMGGITKRQSSQLTTALEFVAAALEDIYDNNKKIVNYLETPYPGPDKITPQTPCGDDI